MESPSQQHLLQMHLLLIFCSTLPALSHKKHTNKPPARARPDKPPLEALDGPKAAWWKSLPRQHGNPVPMRTARLSHGLPLCPSPFIPNDSSKERPCAVCAAAPDPLPLPFPAQTSRNFAAKQAHRTLRSLPAPSPAKPAPGQAEGLGAPAGSAGARCSPRAWPGSAAGAPGRGRTAPSSCCRFPLRLRGSI